MTTQLGRPASEEDLYLARGADVEPFRPVLQGDIFSSVVIPGVDVEHGYAMLASHPCSMRQGASLRPRLQMIPVVTYQDVPFQQWPLSQYRVFPLPHLDPARPSRHFAAMYEEVGMVKAVELTPDRRAACLSERGILLFQQRQIYNASRADISLATLEEASAAVLAEAELLEDWNRALLNRRVETGEEVISALAAEAAEFEAILSSPPEGEDASLRDMLKIQHRRPNVRRVVRREIMRRLEG